MVSCCAGKFKKKEKAKKEKREISRSRKESLGPFLIASGRTKSLSFANEPTRWNTGNTPARNDIVSARGRTAGYVVNGTAIRRSNSVGIGPSSRPPSIFATVHTVALYCSRPTKKDLSVRHLILFFLHISLPPFPSPLSLFLFHILFLSPEFSLRERRCRCCIM